MFDNHVSGNRVPGRNRQLNHSRTCPRFHLEGLHRDGSADDPHYEIRGDKTDHHAVHMGRVQNRETERVRISPYLP